jgi:hypothetical protein
MVGVLVNYDLIAGPEPVSDDVVIERGNVPVEIVKPEAFPVSSHKVELHSKTTAEMSVRPRLSEVVIRIVAAGIMTDPFIVPGVNVRNGRMTLLVHGNAVLGSGSGLLTA